MFQGQFDLENQGQVLNLFEMWSIHGSSLKVKFQMLQKLLRSQKHTDDKEDADDDEEPKTICLPQSGGGGTKAIWFVDLFSCILKVNNLNKKILRIYHFKIFFKNIKKERSPSSKTS